VRLATVAWCFQALATISTARLLLGLLAFYAAWQFTPDLTPVERGLTTCRWTRFYRSYCIQEAGGGVRSGLFRVSFAAGRYVDLALEVNNCCTAELLSKVSALLDSRTLRKVQRTTGSVPATRI
jgi:hypothetical protein